jgi:hypothetical protein
MDMTTANFLLPYLVWDSICYGQEQHTSQIASEIVG